MQFPKPGKYQAKLVNKTFLNEKTLRVELEIFGKLNFSFISGQFISVQVSPTNFRSYSIVSDYKSPQNIILVLSVGHDGVGAAFFRSLEKGDEVSFIGPSGRFVLPEKFSENILMGATGTGLVPLVSMLYELKDRKCTSKIRLYFGVRYENDLFKIVVLDKFKAELSDFDYFTCVSSPTEDWHGLKGRITNFLDISGRAGKTEAFICGNNNMIEDAIVILTSRGVSLEKIYHEKFGK